MALVGTAIVDLPKEIGRGSVLVKLKGIRTYRTRLWLSTKIAMPFAAFLMRFIMWVAGMKCEIETSFDFTK